MTGQVQQQPPQLTTCISCDPFVLRGLVGKEATEVQPGCGCDGCGCVCGWWE